MHAILIALAVSGVGVAPLALFKKKVVAALVLGAIAFIVLSVVFYLVLPTTIWPILGFPGFCVAVIWVIAAIIDGVDENDITLLWLAPVLYVLVLLGVWIYSWSMFNANTYATMIGPVAEREWTKDVQPKDPHHLIMVSETNALYIAKKAVANAGAIGSQFSLDSDHMTMQKVKDHLFYVIPFDFAGFSAWSNSAGSPGFITVDAEDPERAPVFVQLPKDKQMHYTPGAYFAFDLERHLRNNGFLNDGLSQERFELDDEGKPWWVITTYKPTVGWSGEKITDVVTIDPVSGEIRRFEIAKAPEWIDRIIPRSLLKEYLTWYGLYSGGWLNCFWGHLNLTEPEDPILIYGAENRAEWVTGITSTNSNDDSLVGLIYTDSRTGKSVMYRTNGGATDTAIIAAVNSNQQVQFKHLVATTPQIYNIYGNMTAVVPLLNQSDAFQGVAMVLITNIQDVAVGTTQSEALRNYQAILSRHGQQVSIEKSHAVQELRGVVDRIRQDVGASGSIYLFHLKGVTRIFSASSGDNVKIALTQPGDNVVVQYVASGEDVVPTKVFDNLSLPLDKTAGQKEVEQTAKESKKAEEVRSSAKDITSRIKEMPPEELQRLDNLLQQKK